VGTRQEIAPKLLGETRTYQFDFSSLLGSGVTISTQSVTATVYSGTDATPSNIISGSATASGAIVSQKITAGTLGVLYELLCQITTSDSQTLQMVGLLAVIPDEP
jgi:hypothetical protein